MVTKITIQDMKKIAKKHGGKCLSDTYINNKTKLLWECKEGHRWWTTPHSIRNGKHWCHKCAYKKQGEKYKKTIEDMHKRAEKHGGKCLSTKYYYSDVPLKWQCEKGHTWMATPNSIQQGKWCPHCAGNAPWTLERIQKVAQSHGGKLRSKEYINNLTPLRFECEKRHRWTTNIASIKKGSWCPRCSGQKAWVKRQKWKGIWIGIFHINRLGEETIDLMEPLEVIPQK